METARLPVIGGGRKAPAQKSGGCCEESSREKSATRNTARTHFPKLGLMKRDEVPCDQVAVVANAPRCQRGAVGRRSRDEPQQARERRAGGDHRQRHLRPVLPARRLRVVPRRSEDHGRGWGARQASATGHGRLPRCERVGGAGPRPAVRRDERQGRRTDRYVRATPTNEPEPRAPSAAPAPRRSRAAASPRDPDSTVSSSRAPETSASAEPTPDEPPSLLETGALNATAPRGKRAVASIVRTSRDAPSATASSSEHAHAPSSFDPLVRRTINQLSRQTSDAPPTVDAATGAATARKHRTSSSSSFDATTAMPRRKSPEEAASQRPAWDSSNESRRTRRRRRAAGGESKLLRRRGGDASRPVARARGVREQDRGQGGGVRVREW